MKNITEEMGLQEEWYKRAREIKPNELQGFIEELTNKYGHDYGTVCHAIAAASIATAWSMNEKLGITGFQAGAVMWQFIKEWNYSRNKTGLRIIDYDKMLYPQYEEEFDKIISKERFELLQKEAEKNLLNITENTSIRVVRHWESIVDGKAPFGYKIEGSDE